MSEGHLIMKFYLAITVVPLNRISSFNFDENAAVTAAFSTVEIEAVCEQLKNLPLRIFALPVFKSQNFCIKKALTFFSIEKSGQLMFLTDHENRTRLGDGSVDSNKI